MKFEKIFKEDGMYVSDSFAQGVCFNVRNKTLYMLTYENKNDINPTEEIAPVYLGLFNKKYKKVYTRQSLFNKN